MVTRTHGRMIQTASIGAENLQAGSVTRPALRRYSSTVESWGEGDTRTFAHGLGVVPWHVQVYARYIADTAEGGFEQLDEFAWPGPQWRADATNVYVTVGDATQSALRKDTGVAFNLTPADWLLRIEAHG